MEVPDRKMNSIWTGTPLKTQMPAIVYCPKTTEKVDSGELHFPLWQKVNRPQSHADLQWVITATVHSRGHPPCHAQRTEFHNSREMDQCLLHTDTRKAVSKDYLGSSVID